jgi:hypothetical protein
LSRFFPDQKLQAKNYENRIIVKTSINSKTMEIDNYEVDEDAERGGDSSDNNKQRRRRIFPGFFKSAIWKNLSDAMVDGQLPRGKIEEISKSFCVSRRVVGRIFEEGRRCAESGTVCNFEDKRHVSQKKLKYDPLELKEKIKALPIEQRSTVRASAANLDIPKSTFYDYEKYHGVFVKQTVTLKPRLTPWHRQQRMNFVKEHIEGDYYGPQFDTIHIDEKWFYVDKKTRKVYLADDENIHYRDNKNVQYMEKVMFLAAVSRPMKYNPTPESLAFRRIEQDPDDWYYTGKIGMYPIVQERPAARSDKRTGLQRGDNLITPVSVTAEVFEEIVIEKLLPDIAFKYPFELMSMKFKIQLDNATPHKVDSEKFKSKCEELGIDCSLVYQPPQSPDTNICDLSFFPAIQALYYKTPGVKNVKTCIEAVKNAFAEYDPNKLNRGFLSLFMNYNMILMNGGSNKYPTPHMSKEMLERKGILPDRILVWKVPETIFNNNNNDDDNGALDVDNNYEAVGLEIEMDDDEIEFLEKSEQQYTSQQVGKRDKNEDNSDDEDDSSDESSEGEEIGNLF